MSSTTCPNCGKPLRPGAKFCGNCGATLPGGAAARPPRAAAPAPPDHTPCPQCGKPVRVGARFCAHCGQAIGPGDQPKPAAEKSEPKPVTPTFAPTEAAAKPPPAGRTQTAAAEAGATAERRPPPAPPVRPARRRGLGLAIILILLVGCGLLAGGGYILSNRMGWINLGGAATATATIVVESSPTATTAPATETQPATATLTAIPVSTPTASPPPPGAASTPTEAAAALSPVSSPVSATEEGGLAPKLLFDDTFDTALSDNWLAWGDKRPRIDRGPGDRWLYLAAEDPGEAGVTSRRGLPVYNAPGTVVEFEGALDASYSRSVMLFDWDPEKTVRGPDYREPGLVRLEIRGARIKLVAPLTRESYEVELDAFEKHTYRLVFQQGKAVALYVDDNQDPACRITDMGLAPVPGAISFSGLGWVTRVQVMQGPLP